MTENLAAATYERPLAQVLQPFRGREMLFVQPGGNWGDGLIYLGAETLAKRLGVPWKPLTYEQFIAIPPDHARPVYIHGGGGFNFFCSGRAPAAFLFAVRRYRGPVVLGPTTVDDEEGFVEAKLLPGLRERTASEVVMFVRERTSLNALVGRLPADIALHLDHDTALQLAPDDALNGYPQKSRYELLALREDNEAPAAELGAGYAGVRLDPAYYARSFDHWVRIHALAKRIITNRAHSSMMGAILGKPTILMSGSYHKNRSLWEYSLKRRGVGWLELGVGLPNVPHSGSAWKDLPLFSRVARSSRLQRTLKCLRGVPWA